MSDFKIEYENISQRVYRILKEMILKGSLQSGQKMPQNDLANQLGVSRTPLLSAFSKLEKENLVEIIPRRGAYVKKLTIEELIHIYDIRLRLEPLGTLEAANNGTPEEMNELEILLNKIEIALQDGGNGLVKEEDYYFHMKIMEMSKNKFLYSILSSLNIIVSANSEGLLKDPSKSYAEHKEILYAIRNKAPQVAHDRMYIHLLDSHTTLLEKLKAEQNND